MQRLTPVALALSLAWGMSPAAALAQGKEAAIDTATRLKEVTVTATRTVRRVDDVPSTVTVTSHEQIEEQGARDLKDMLKNEIDLSVRTGPSRYSVQSATGRTGVESINIRGLEGNQVLMAIDGVRLPYTLSFGPFVTGRGDYIDVDSLKSAEVLRGPASTQYGSDGLAGVLALRTLDPADVLKTGRATGGFARLGYSSVDDSWVGTLALAGRTGDWEGLLLTTYRDGDETDNQGDNDSRNATRTAPNPADYRARSLLAKGIWHANPANRFALAFERQTRKQEVDSLSSRSATVLGFDSTDRLERNRASLEHQFSDPDGAWLQKARTTLYWQTARTNQFSYEDRSPAVDRTRENTYEADAIGLSTQFESSFRAGLDQRLTYGFDLMRSETSGVRDGTVAPVGETFPAKAFPDTAFTTAGLFVQSEIEAGAVSVIPGVRFDYYELKPSRDGFAGTVVDLSDQAVTPRLGAVWRLAPGFAPYAQWAQGFRAPTPDQVNNGFENLTPPGYPFAPAYRSIGNADLKPERSNGFEIGFRGRIDSWRYSVGAFSNRYTDFISQEKVGGSGTTADPDLYQYVNLSNARIRGLEFRTEWAITSYWSATAGVAYARGDTKKDGTEAPLNTINPLKAVLGVRYDDEVWGLRANLTHSEGKKASRIDNGTDGLDDFAPPSHTTLDLGMTWKPRRDLTVTANLNNVFDTKYWRWSDVRGLNDNSVIKDAYTAPGRNFQVSLRLDF